METYGHSFQDALEVKEVQRLPWTPTRHAPELRLAPARHRQRQTQWLLRHLALMWQVDMANLEEPHVVCVLQIRSHYFQHARQETVPHHDSLAADRVDQANICPDRQPQRLLARRLSQRIGDDLLQA